MRAPRPERHLDPDAAGSPLATLPGLTGDRGTASRTVTVIVGPTAATTARGQLLTWVTVNLLLRCYGALDTVAVRCAETTLIKPLPTLDTDAAAASTLRQSLRELAAALADPTREYPTLQLIDTPPASDTPAAATLLIGFDHPADTGVATESPATQAWVLSASSWKAAVVSAAARGGIDTGALPRLDAPGDVMVGVWFAAALGVGEAFKVLGRLRPDAGRFIDVLSADLWNGTIGDCLDALAGDDGPVDGLTLPAHWVAGAGAVGQAYLAVLSTSEVDTDIGALDHDDLDDGNLNRHIVAGVADIGAGKAPLAQQRLATSRTRIVALPYKWQVWVGTHPDSKPPLPAPLADQSRNQRYGLVISAVDKNDARTALAGSHPAVVFSASTNGLNVECGRYGRDSPWQCLGCASPLVAARTLEHAAAELRDRSDPELAALAARAGVDADKLREYLDNPVCGTLGEREMAKFAAFTRPDWSVSFVSVAAGTLLAARVLRHVGGLGNDDALLQRGYPADGDTLRLWMATARFARTAHRRRRDCPICSGAPARVPKVDDHRIDPTW